MKTGYDARWVPAAREAAFGPAIAIQDAGHEYEHTWVPALVQHYGPGSYYLDVTGSVDIALWFALNSFRSHKSMQMLQTAAGRSPVAVYWSWYEPVPFPWQQGAAEPVIYVFDVRCWPGFGRPAHGDLVAVAKLPDGQRLLHRATRLERQDAYLLYADPDAFFGPDLGHLPRSIIRLTASFHLDGTAAKWNARDVFPPPTKDPCYAVLLAMSLNERKPSGEYTHPLEIPCYVSSYPPPTVEADEFISRLHGG